GRAGGHRHRAGREARPTALGNAHPDSDRVGDPARLHSRPAGRHGSHRVSAELPARDVELRALLLRADDRAGAVRVVAWLRHCAGRSGLRAGAHAAGPSRRSMTTRLLARQSPVVIRLARFANATDRPVEASWASRLTRFTTASPSSRAPARASAARSPSSWRR